MPHTCYIARDYFKRFKGPAANGTWPNLKVLQFRDILMSLPSTENQIAAGTYTSSVKVLALNRVLLVLAFLGLFVAGVLSAGHLLNLQVPCGLGVSDCETVAQSPYSKIFTIPVAYFGFLTYIGLCALGWFRGVGDPKNFRKLVLYGYLLSAVGTVFSLYLQYQSFFVIHATCKWCLASATIMIISFILHAVLFQSVETRPVTESLNGKFESVVPIALSVIVALGLMVTVAGMNDGKNAPMVFDGGGELPVNLREILLASGHKEGPENAPVTIVEFADLQCPSCQTSTPQMKQFAAAHPDTVQMVFHHFPLKSKHEWAVASAAMSEYAAEKGKFWPFTLGVMDMQREVQSADELYSIASKIGLNVEDIKKRLGDKDDKAYKAVEADLDLADKFGLNMTPTFFIFPKDGRVEMANSQNVLEMLDSPKYKKLLDGK
ncbi:hypothetical protein BH11ARM1_BH11ARM1_06810 [soil metagenome]